jgi:hypothetical protein
VVGLIRHHARNRLAAFAVATLALVLARDAGAQSGLWVADSLLAEGRLASAESAYYAAARQAPRDPVARAALGRYLAARGGTRAGAVLIEEAQFFGGDSAALSRLLVPLFVRLGDYESLERLNPPQVLSPIERRRVRWLSSHRPEARLRDSVVLVSYRAVGNGSGFGTVIVRFGKSQFPAVIDPRVSGLIVPSSARRDVRTFGTEKGSTLGVTDTLRVGPAVFSHVPTVVGQLGDSVRIGFDVLAPYFPGFDPAKGLMTLRRVGRRDPSPQGIRVPALFDSNGMRVLIGNRWHPTTASGPSMLLATRRWIWDWRLGDVVLLP